MTEPVPALAFCLPWQSVAGGVAVLAAGAGYRLLRVRRARESA